MYLILILKKNYEGAHSKRSEKLNQFFNEGGFPRKPSNPLLLESDVVCFITNIVADDRLSV